MYSFRTLSPAKADLEKGMKVVATTVGSKGPESQVHNQERLDAAKQALIKAKQMLADVLVLPGGFFTSNDYQSRKHIANSLINESKKSDIAVVFGVDEKSIESSNVGVKGKKQQRSTGLSLYPMYAYAWSPTDNKKHWWQQRSIVAVKRQKPLINAYDEVRLVKIGTETLAVLLCGEIFNQHIRDALRNCKSRPNIVADLGHIGAGFEIHLGMEPLGEGKQGIASMCSLHVQGQNAKKRYCTPSRGYMSTNISDRIVNGPPRIEIKLLDFSLQNPAACIHLTTSLTVPPPY